MNLNLILFAVLFSICIIIFILHLVAKERVNIKYAIVWLLMFIIIIVFTLIPGCLAFFTNLLGFQTPSNMVLTIMIAVLVIINITNTVINSDQDKKIRLLVQEVSILKNKIK